MIHSLPEEIINILDTVDKAGYEIYVVGGAVRDMLTGRTVTDWDFTTNAIPDQIVPLFEDSFYDNTFGTVGIPAVEAGLKPYEITTFRREFGYSDARRPDKIEWGKTLEEDLSRRDFTINAMALTRDMNIIDPYGGQKDLEKKVIRSVGDAYERISEDALRMMRAVRIAAETGFKIEENTLNAIRGNVGLIHKIARERVRDELMKTITSANPKLGIELLRETGLLAEILPELEKTFGVEQKSPQRHHIYDVGTHSIMSLANTRSRDPIVRFAALIHDIGKPQTFKKQENGVITFYNHEVIGARIAKNIADRLRFSKRDRDKLWKLVRWHQFTVDEHQTDTAIRRFITRVGLENVEDMLDVRVADRLGGGARETSWRLEEFKKRLIEVQKQPFTVHDLKISGEDVMHELNIPPGPKVGELLKQLFDDVVEKRVENDKEMLIARLDEYRE